MTYWIVVRELVICRPGLIVNQALELGGRSDQCSLKHGCWHGRGVALSCESFGSAQSNLVLVQAKLEERWVAAVGQLPCPGSGQVYNACGIL